MNHNLSAEEMLVIEKLIENDDLQKLNDNLPSLGLTVSYDMGWQRRSGGRVYDSISGHGFLIGCRSKKVINFGI